MKHKYRAKKTEKDGILFDSKGEANRYCKLKMKERCGGIRNLRLQVPFTLIPAIYFDKRSNEYTFEKRSGKNGFCVRRCEKYIADFVYDENGEQIVEDFKGFRTSVYKRKARMMMKLYEITIRETHA